MNHIFIEERSLLRRVCNEIIQHELEFYGMHAFLTMKNVKLLQQFILGLAKRDLWGLRAESGFVVKVS